jgi:glycosyltransferase involved in cell wall biosynthesis
MTTGSGLIVLCAANAWDGTPMADWHVARHLARLAPVLYADPPLSLATGNPAAVAKPRLRPVTPGLWRLTPAVQPFPSRRGMTGLTTFLARRYLRAAIARLGGKATAVIAGWPQYPVIGTCGEDVAVYWSHDDYAGGAALLGMDAGMLDRRERQAAAGADIVAAVSPVLADRWRGRGHEVLLLPNGTDAGAYAGTDSAPLPADVRLPGPVAGVIGRLNARTDIRLLEAVAQRGRSLLLVGPLDPRFEPERFTALLRRPNVHWAGPQPAAALPGYLRAMHVGLVPYGDSVFNRGSFPLKTLEYLAAGRAVVATSLPSVRWLATDLVTIADGPGAFAGAVDDALGQPRTPELVRARREFAGQHSWQRRAAELHAAIMACQAGK